MRKIRYSMLGLLLVVSAAFATTITDNFPTNGATLGANWTVAHGISLEVVSNTAQNDNFDGSYDGNFHVTTLATADQYVEAVISGTGASNFFDLKLRTDGVEDTADGYNCGVGGTADYYIQRIDNGSSDAIAGGTGTTVFLNGDTIRCEIEGTTLRLYVNDILIDSVTDATYSTGAYVGMGIFDGTDSSPSFDDFAAGDLGGGGTVRNPITGRLGQIVH